MTDFWVSNASPLITLAAIDRLDIFAALNAEVRVPTTVLTEVGAGAATDRADDRVRESGRFVLVDDVPILTQVERWGLDPGEAQAVSQALETAAKGVILDDLAGRRCAQALGLRVIGTLGLIARAKRVGVIAEAAPVIAAVREAGLYLSEALVRAVLKELGEA
jgi:predicted nucleic acid-binding protein